MREIKKAIRNQVDPSQMEYFDAIKWLIGDGPRASGRTHLLALSFIDKALKTGSPVELWDHHGGRGDLRHLLDRISQIVCSINEELDSIESNVNLDLNMRTTARNSKEASMFIILKWKEPPIYKARRADGKFII